MIVEESKRRKVAVVIKRTMVCNGCGRAWQIEPWEDSESLEAQEVSSLRVVGGYGNRRWGDLVELALEVCQDCLADWISTFKIPPAASEVDLISGNRTPIPDFTFPDAAQVPRA